MQPKIIEQLKKLKSVKPGTDFAAATRQLILAVPQPRRFIFPVQIWALGGAVAVLILVLVISIAGFGRISTLSDLTTNSEEIDREFKNLSINIQLQEISYRQSVNEVIASALGEISDSGPSYLKSSILERELDSLEIGNNLEKREKIEELLNKIIF
jgi:hypothetical protein